MLFVLLGCIDDDVRVDEPDVVPVETASVGPVVVTVTVDGASAVGARVKQVGTELEAQTGSDGTVTIDVDRTVPGDLWIAAAYPGAWNRGVAVTESPALTIALDSYDPADNPDYVFADPGAVAEADTNSAECGHCHLTLHEDWSASPHAGAAKNPAVQAVYQGISAADAEACAEAKGWWGAAVVPGTGEGTEACHVAASVAESLGTNGGCADCHAPGIGGATLAGHDLLEATGVAYEDGVHCDICHKVAAVEPGTAPGVGGWLTLLRPSDPPPSPLLGAWHPLTFGPYVDVLNPLMGAVASETFHEAALCGGCHELEQAAAGVDTARWPLGKLPVMSTFSEWQAGPMNPGAPCQSCHMPPAPEVGNSADLGNGFPKLNAGVAAGWWRAPGSVSHHSWVGPRTPESGMLELAAFVDVVGEAVDGRLEVEATVKNVGPGHAIPTGDPLRNLVLRVEANCDGTPLAASGGDVVPAFVGELATRALPDPLDSFDGAEPGDVIRFVRTAGMVDYDGPGVFGDGTFAAAEKGLPQLEFVAEATVISVDADGTLTLDPPGVPAAADAAFLAPGDDLEGAAAGLPGFAFARVLAAADGGLMVPHALAVDVVSDNRLSPGTSWTSHHEFVATCAAPEVTATLHWRRFPWIEARRYGWDLGDREMARVTR